MFFLALLDSDCSGRSLAALLVAWVTTAMVASLLVRWEYMWIVLVVLTFFFLLLCGYTAYNVKQAHERFLLEEQRRTIVRTVSGITSINCREANSSAYHLGTDLPPSYASVVTVQATSTPSEASGNINRSAEEKFKDPPPYSIVVASLNMQDQNVGTSSKSNVLPSATAKKDSASIAATNVITSASTRSGSTHVHTIDV